MSVHVFHKQLLIAYEVVFRPGRSCKARFASSASEIRYNSDVYYDIKKSIWRILWR